MKNDDPGSSLDQLLGEVPRDLAPSRNLWPSIASRIQPAPRRSRPMLMAACVATAAACLATVFTWAVLRRAATPAGLTMVARAAPLGATPSGAAPLGATPSGAAPLGATPSGAAPFTEPRDPRYVKAHDALQRSFRERLALLDPATRAKIEASLAVIRQAHESIRQALLADPSSPVLEELWQSTGEDEIDLYDRVVDATQASMRI
jgi:hypothetical protein